VRLLNWFISFIFLLVFCTSDYSDPGDLGTVTPEQLQFMLDLGGDGPDKRMAKEMEVATQYAVDKHTQAQKTAFVAAALELLELLPRDGQRQRDLALLRNPGSMPLDVLEQAKMRLISSEQSETVSYEKMLMTGIRITDSLSESEVQTLVAQFADFHWDYLKEHNPRSEVKVEKGKDGLSVLIAGMFLGGYLKSEDLLPQINTFENETNAAMSEIELAEAQRRMQQNRELAVQSGMQREVIRAIRPADPEDTEPSEKDLFHRRMSMVQPPLSRRELLDCERTRCARSVEGVYYGRYSAFGIFMAYQVGFSMPEEESGRGQEDTVWGREVLPRLKEEVLSIRDWLQFTEVNQIIEQVDEKGETTYAFMSSSYVINAFNAGSEFGIVGPAIQKLMEGRNLPTWFKFIAGSRAAARLMQAGMGTRDVQSAIASTTVFALERGLHALNKPMVVSPALLTHHFAKTIEDFATKFDISRLKKYTGSAGEVIEQAKLQSNGIANVAGRSLLKRAFARGFAIEVAVDMAVRFGGAAWKGDHMDRAEIAGQQFVVGGRDRIQLMGDGNDTARLRNAALEDAWDDWSRRGIQNSVGYVTGAAAGAVATPFVFGLAAAAGAPTAGVGSVVVAVAGWSAIGAIATGASQLSRSATEGLDDSFNLVRLKDRLNGIFVDMTVNQDRSLQDADGVVSQVVSAASTRYMDSQNMKYMLFVESFDKVELKKVDGLTHISIHQKHGNFLDSSRVNSWENYFINIARNVSNPVGWLVSAISSHFTSTATGVEALTEESREARIAHDFYDISGNQAQWDDYTDEIVPVGPISKKGVVFVGVSGDKIEISDQKIGGTEDDSDLRILSNGLVMARNERDRQKWVIKGRCEDFDIYIRKEVGSGSGRYSCEQNVYRYSQQLNEIRPPVFSTQSAVASSPVSSGQAVIQAQTPDATGALDEAFQIIAP